MISETPEEVEAMGACMHTLTTQCLHNILQLATGCLSRVDPASGGQGDQSHTTPYPHTTIQMTCILIALQQ